MKIQPLILAECWSLFSVGLQIYFQRIFLLWKGCTRWVIRVCLVLVLLPTFPFAFILSLLVSLVSFFFLFCSSTPLGVALNSSWPACLSKLYRSSLFVRLPALKICVQFIDYCVLWLAGFGGYCLLLLFFRGVLLTILLAFTTVLLFPEKSLPFAACFLLFCYYLFSNYSKFTDRYHDSSDSGPFRSRPIRAQQNFSRPIRIAHFAHVTYVTSQCPYLGMVLHVTPWNKEHSHIRVESTLFT